MIVFCDANLQSWQENLLDAVFIDLQEHILTEITPKHPGGVDITLAPCEDTAVAVTLRGEKRKKNP